MTHRSRLFFFTASVVLGTLLVAGTVGYKIGISSLEETSRNRLVQARQFKAQELQKDFASLSDSLIITSEVRRIKDFLIAFPQEHKKILTWLRSHGSESTWRSVIAKSYDSSTVTDIDRALAQMSPFAIFLQAQFIQESILQNKTPRDVLKVPSIPTFAPYLKKHETLHPFLLQTMDRLKISDIILIDANGVVAYTAQKNLDLGVQLLSGPFVNSRLAQTYRWSMEASQNTTSFFDFFPMTHFWNVSAAFIATPLFEKSNFIGTLVFQIPLERVDAILSNNHDWESLGLLKTGEIVAYGPEGLLRNNSRLFIENPEQFLAHYQKVANNAETIRRNRTTALSVGLPSQRLAQYLENRDFIETANDYFGTKTLRSVGKVHLGNTDWILISKISLQEAYNPLTNKFIPVLLATLFMVLVALGAAYWMAKWLFNPLQTLSTGLENLKTHSLPSKLRVPPKGEFKKVFENYNDVSEDFLRIKLAKEFLEHTVQSLHEAFFFIEVHNENGKESLRIRGLNPAAASMVGISVSSLKGTDLQMWIDTDYQKILKALKKEDESSLTFSMEGVLKKISGEKIPLELSWALIKNRGMQTPIFVLIGKDIYWKKEIEKKLILKEDLLKESQSLSQTGSFRWDVKTGRSLWSEEEYHLLGLDPAATEPSYDLFRSLIVPEDLAIFDEALADAHKNIRPLQVDIRIKKHDSNEIVWMRCHGRTEYDDYGNAVLMYGTTQDITELRRVEQSLVTAKNDALKSSQAKSEFLARMSHEIRTPMNAIMGMAELLNETTLNSDQQYYVTIFRKAGEVLMALINDILDLSKIEAGEVSIENIPFDLKKLMIDVEEMMKPRALEKGLNYSFEINAGVSSYLMGDPTKLRQVLINLVSNSLKFTESGYIRVSVGKNPSKKDALMVSVTDSGVGIPASKQHLIFQKFSQADSTITRRYGGTGLGLAISKSLIELMGGQIWFKSREGMGTSFFFTIPYREQVYNPSTHAPLAMTSGELDFVPPKQRDPNKKIRILIADDTDDNRTLFTHYLKNGPYEIIEAENGLEAIDKIKSGQFDIVFMDVQMPEMDGYAATGTIRKWEEETHNVHVPIIALTAHALSEDRQKSLRAGCDDHIAKPFKKETLLGVINRYSL